MEFSKFSGKPLRMLSLGLGGAIASALLLGGFDASAQTAEGRYVRTGSGIGIYVRSTPALDDDNIIGGYADGEYVQLSGRRQSADGFTWAELADRSGWVATEYLVFDRPDTDGPSTLIPRGTTIGGPYVVAVPGDSETRLNNIRRYVPVARFATSSQGDFIYAGGFRNRSDAETLATILRGAGFDARVTYNRYY